MTQPWGATPDEWAHFDVILGLSDDLLPVVSNPDATISPDSKMKAIGKTPSVYNRRREVVGITSWTSKIATGAELGAWSKESDYGICVQARRVRAIDIDIGDGRVARSVVEFVRDRLGGLRLPTRQRSNSGKCLLAFYLEGDFGKRHFKTETGLVEFLATGQQFIAVGTHPSGARYEWEGGLPDELPVLSAEQFEELWAALIEQFAVEPATATGGTARRGKALEASAGRNDALYDWLATNAIALDYGSEGQAYIECPWKDGHSGDSGVTECAYFPRGTRGYERGHFKCLHASCSARTDSEFEEALGYRMDEIEDVPARIDDAGGVVVEIEPLPPMKQKKDSSREATLPNLEIVFNRPDFFGVKLRYDTFYQDTMMAPYGTEAWVRMTDADYVSLRTAFERDFMFMPIGDQMMRHAVLKAARDHKFDTAQYWLDTLPVWDGVPRVENFFPRYFGVEDSPYARAVGRYIWTALVGRVLVPGIKADMAPVLVGPQGQGKSSGIAAMVPAPEFFTEIDLMERGPDLARQMQGKMIAEIGEMRGLKRAEKEAVKAFISRQVDEWIKKYQETLTSAPRRLLFIGTTNQDEFLEDDTGNRRWLPMNAGNADVVGIDRDRAQLWAEAKEMFYCIGVDWSAENLAGEAHASHLVRDPWDAAIEKWLTTPELSGDGEPELRDVLRSEDVLAEALYIPAAKMTKTDKDRAGASLRRIGYKSVTRKIAGKNVRCWVKS